MRAVALKGLAARKVRALLTALAVVIGVAMVSGTFILTDTTLKSFTGLFTASTANTDAVISGKEIVKNSTNGSGVTIPASMLDRVRALPEVETAAGEVSPQEANVADIIGSDGKKAAMESVGGSYDTATAGLSPFKLKTGKAPHGPGEVAIDAGTASKKHYEVGDSVVVSTLGKKHTFRISGTLSYGNVDSLGFASIAAWDVKTAQSLLNREGRYDAISVAAKDGTPSAQLVNAIKPLVGSDLEVKDSKVAAKDSAENINDGLKTIRLVLLGFGGIALLVGAFVIFNTLSITVAQRTREFATLRTLGASRKQVKRSVVLEGLVIGLAASAAGLVAGIGIAKGMIALMSALGVDLPEASTVIATRTVTVSMLVGTSVTVLASVLPARRATRVPPIAAVREGSTLPPGRFAAHSAKSGLAVLLASLAAVATGMFAGVAGALMALLLVLGVLGLFMGIALLAPSLVKPLARVVGWPARRAGGVAGDLAGANAVRNPGRTASTAAALMIGLTLVTVVAALGAGITAGTKAAISDQIHADYVVDGNEDLPFRADEGDKLASTQGVKAASHVRADEGLVQGEENTVTGVDPATIARFYTFKWTSGSQRTLGQLGSDGALVTKSYAEGQHLKVGSSVSITTPSGTKRTLVVRGIYDPPSANQLLGDVSMSQQAFDKAFENPKNKFTFLAADAGADQALKAAAKDISDAKLHTGAAYPGDATKDMKVVLAMLYVLLGFSVVVSLFGMVNTMVLSVFERTREIGMLRTIGMTRRQARRMIRHESVITALIGAALGLGLGLFLSGLASGAVGSESLPFTVPVPALMAFTLLSVIAGIGAAIMPARRASRLNVLDALHYE
ncbi:MAG TPA: FtsX-like permease family protein [Solirubrobacteraceae bacterium]